MADPTRPESKIFDTNLSLWWMRFLWKQFSQTQFPKFIIPKKSKVGKVQDNTVNIDYFLEKTFSARWIPSFGYSHNPGLTPDW